MGLGEKYKYPMTWEQAVLWLREQPGKEQLVRDCYFDDPLIEAARRYYNEAEWRCVRSLLPKPPGEALDVGAGRGISSYSLALDGWSVTALEPDPSPLVGAEAIRSLARESWLNIEVIQQWGEELPFADNRFDIIHARQVLHHAVDLSTLCKELYRVLRPGGVLVATRDHVINRQDDLPIFLASHPLQHLYGGENAYTVREYMTALTGAGFILNNILSPYETPINYFPATEKSIHKAVGRIFFGRLWLLDIPLPRRIVNCVSKKLKTPGRLYSFVGEKSGKPI
ncbi:MAG: class I SAM-dependent methyltransferase [Spirochaetota bacterium]